MNKEYSPFYDIYCLEKYHKTNKIYLNKVLQGCYTIPLNYRSWYEILKEIQIISHLLAMDCLTRNLSHF